MSELSLTGFRKELHCFPELSGKEIATAQRVINFICRFNPTYTIEQIGGTGVAGVYEFGEGGNTVMIRCELDALPIQEVNTFDHRSTVEKVSHMCGHDGHMAIVAGLAQWLDSVSFESGKVVLLFQPAEETGEGAEAILADPKFRRIEPDVIFALHNIPGYPGNQVILTEGVFTATVQSVAVCLFGKEAHAAEPEKGINPAAAIAELINRFRTMTVADPASDDFALITPVYAAMGQKDYGISAANGELHLTFRTWKKEAMEMLTEQIRAAIDEIAHHHGLNYTTEWFDYFPATPNDPECNGIIMKAAAENGLNIEQRPHPFKFGEDFGSFTQRYRGAMFGLGAGIDTPALHNPDYDFPDEIIPAGVRMFKGIIQRALE